MDSLKYPLAIAGVATIALISARWSKWPISAIRGPHPITLPTTTHATLQQRDIVVINGSIAEGARQITETTRVVVLKSPLRTENDANLLAAGLQGKNLEEISINTGLGKLELAAEKTAELASTLFRAIASNQSLQRLNVQLAGQPVTASTLQPLRNLTSLNTLSLQSARYSDDAAQSLGSIVADTIISNVSVHEGEFSSPEVLASFLSTVNTNSLRHLDIDRVAFKDETTKWNPGNPVAGALLRLARNENLRELVIGKTECLGDSQDSWPRSITGQVSFRQNPLDLLIMETSLHATDNSALTDWLLYAEIRRIKASGTAFFGYDNGPDSSIFERPVRRLISRTFNGPRYYVPDALSLSYRLWSSVSELWDCWVKGATDMGKPGADFCCGSNRPALRNFAAHQLQRASEKAHIKSDFGL